jgi:hypothetical protein
MYSVAIVTAAVTVAGLGGMLSSGVAEDAAEESGSRRSEGGMRTGDAVSERDGVLDIEIKGEDDSDAIVEIGGGSSV